MAGRPRYSTGTIVARDTSGNITRPPNRSVSAPTGMRPDGADDDRDRDQSACWNGDSASVLEPGTERAEQRPGPEVDEEPDGRQGEHRVRIKGARRRGPWTCHRDRACPPPSPAVVVDQALAGEHRPDALARGRAESPAGRWLEVAQIPQRRSVGGRRRGQDCRFAPRVGHDDEYVQLRGSGTPSTRSDRCRCRRGSGRPR